MWLEGRRSFQRLLGKMERRWKENFFDHTLQISLKCISGNLLQLLLAVISYSRELAPYSKLFAIHSCLCTNQ